MPRARKSPAKTKKPVDRSNAPVNDTKAIYDAIYAAYDHFNVSLFDGRLSPCLLLLHRKMNAAGYYWPERWVTRDDKENKMAEIALTPEHLSRDPKDILSTLVHEMVHHEQELFGKPGKNGHHNKEWVVLMEKIGLTPKSFDNPGKQTGRKVSHDIDKGGLFDVSCDRFFMERPELKIELIGLPKAPGPKKKDRSKVKHTCPDCQSNAWCKEGFRIVCDDCNQVMEEAT